MWQDCNCTYHAESHFIWLRLTITQQWRLELLRYHFISTVTGFLKSIKTFHKWRWNGAELNTDKRRMRLTTCFKLTSRMTHDGRPMMDDPRWMNHDGWPTMDDPWWMNHDGWTTMDDPRWMTHDGWTTIDDPRWMTHDGWPTMDDPWWMTHDGWPTMDEPWWMNHDGWPTMDDPRWMTHGGWTMMDEPWWMTYDGWPTMDDPSMNSFHYNMTDNSGGTVQQFQ